MSSWLAIRDRGSAVPSVCSEEAPFLSSAKGSCLSLSKVQQLFQMLDGVKRESPSIGSRSFQDVISDISMLLRGGATLGNSISNHLLGLTTAENVVAFYNFSQSVEGYQRARVLRDSQGQLNQVLEGGINFSLGLGGLTFIPARLLSLISQILRTPVSAHSISLLGRATYWTMTVGTVVFGVFYAIFGVWAGVRLYQLARYALNRINQQSTDQVMDGRYLFSKVHAAPRLWAKKQLSHKIDHSFGARCEAAMCGKKLAVDQKEELTLRALDDLSARYVRLHEQMKQEAKAVLVKGECEDGKKLSRKERGALNALIQSKTPSLSETKERLKGLLGGIQVDRKFCQRTVGALGYDVSSVKSLGLDALQVYGLKLEHERRQAKKDAKMERLLGATTVIEIKKAFSRGLMQRLKSHNDEVRMAAHKEYQELCRKERHKLCVETLRHVIYVAAAVLGIAITVLSFTTPVGGVLFLSLSTGFALTMLGVDFWLMVEAFASSEAPGKYDRAYALLIGGELVVSYFTAVGITVGLGFSLLPLLAGGLGIVLPGVVVAGAAFFMASERQKLWDERHLSLGTLKKRLSQELTPGELNRLMKNTQERRELRARYLKLKGAEKAKSKGRQWLTEAMGSSSSLELQRACRKTRKLLWKTAQTLPVDSSRRERAIKRAEWMQSYEHLIQKGKMRKARAYFRRLRRRSGRVVSTLRQELYLIEAMKEDQKGVRKVVKQALQKQRSRNSILFF